MPMAAGSSGCDCALGFNSGCSISMGDGSGRCRLLSASKPVAVLWTIMFAVMYNHVIVIYLNLLLSVVTCGPAIISRVGVRPPAIL